MPLMAVLVVPFAGAGAWCSCDQRKRLGSRALRMLASAGISQRAGLSTLAVPSVPLKLSFGLQQDNGTGQCSGCCKLTCSWIFPGARKDRKTHPSALARNQKKSCWPFHLCHRPSDSLHLRAWFHVLNHKSQSQPSENSRLSNQQGGMYVNRQAA